MDREEAKGLTQRQRNIRNGQGLLTMLLAAKEKATEDFQTLYTKVWTDFKSVTLDERIRLKDLDAAGMYLDQQIEFAKDQLKNYKNRGVIYGDGTYEAGTNSEDETFDFADFVSGIN